MFWIMTEGNREPKRREIDPEKMVEQIEIELMLKRAAWERTRARGNNLRMVSLAFLFVVVLGALIGFYFFISSGDLQELRATAAKRAHASPSPTASP